MICLGLGLGIATTVFATLDAVLRPHVPYRDVARTFSVYHQGDGASRQITPQQRQDALQAASGMFEGLVVAEHRFQALVGTSERIAQVNIATVGAEYVPFMGLRMQRGRAFTAEDGAEGAAILTEDLWRHFFADREIGEARLTVEDRTYPVVGVLPRGVMHPVRNGVLLARNPHMQLTVFSFPLTYVRLRPGVDSAAAQAQLDALARRLELQWGTGRWRFGFRLGSLQPDPFQLREIHGALAGGALAVLLIACANLANLLLARGMARRPDMVLHVALGATRWVIVRQLLTEALVLALSGAALGIVLTFWGAEILRSGIPERLQGIGILEPQISWRVFVFGVVAAVGSAALFGILPAVQATDVRANEALKDGAGTTTRRRHRYSGIVIAEVALTLVLLVGASLLVRTIGKIRAVDFGAAGEQLVAGSVRFIATTGQGRVWRSPSSQQLLDMGRRLPGVVSAAIADEVAPWGMQVLGEGQSTPLYLRGYHRVSPSFVRTRGLMLIAGRDFTEGDAGEAGAAIIDSATAFKLWRDGDAAVGRLIKLGRAHDAAPWVRVVGVTRPAVYFSEVDPYEAAPPEVYVIRSGAQSGGRLLLRTEPGQEAAVALAATRAARDANPGQRGLAWFRPIRQSYDDFVQARGFIGRLFLGIGLLALVLAATGLYAVIAHTVSRRMREFAIRVALGARPADVRRLVVRDAAVMILAGTAIGGLVGLWTGRFVDPWLYGVFYVDAVSLVAAELVLLLAAALAVAVPVRRALRANPVTIIRAI